MIRSISFRAALLTAALLAAALIVASCDVRSRTRLRWIGPVTPTSPSASCTESRAVLTLQDQDVTFAPDEGVWILSGTATPTEMHASRTRIGVDKQPYETILDATWTETQVTGTYTTPRCTFKVKLARQ